MKWRYLIVFFVGYLAGALGHTAYAHADPPACVIGQDTVWNNPVCRDCYLAHPFDVVPACSQPAPPGVKP